MSVISLQCPNCRAKLKAKASAVGQSLACPRCANMLVVTVPQSKSSPQTFESDSLEALLDQPAKAETAKKPSSQHPEDLQVTMPAQSTSQYPELQSGPKGMPATNVHDPRKMSARRTPSDSKPDTKESPKDSLKSVDWKSAKAKQRQVILLGIILGIGTLLIGGSLVYYLISQPNGDAQVAQADTGKNAKLNDPANDVNDNSKASEKTALGDDEAAKQPQPDDRTKSNKVVGSDNAADNKDDPQSTESVANLNQVEPNTGSSETTPNTESTATDGGDKHDEPKEQQNRAPSRESFQDAIDQIFSGDSVFEAEVLTGPGTGDSQGDATPFGKVLVEDQSVQRRQSARYQRPAARSVDVEKLMTTIIAGVRNDQIDALDFIALMERISSLPIWLDAEAFRAAPVSLDQGIAIQAIKQNIEEILSEQLPKFSLGYELSAYGVRVFPQGTQELVTVVYPLPGRPMPAEQPAATNDPKPENAVEDGPLGNVQPEVETKAQPQIAANSEAIAVAALIQQFVHPGQWQTDEAANENVVRKIAIKGESVEVTAMAETHFRVKRLLDQLAASSDNPEQRRENQSLQPLAFGNDDPLQKLIRLDFYSPTPLRKLMEAYGTAIQSRIIIDWPALIDEGWTPDTEVPWIVNNQTAENAIKEFVFDMGLDFKVIAPGVIALTSKSAADKSLDIEVYPANDLLKNVDQWPLLRSRLSQMLYLELKEYPSAYVNYYGAWNCVIAKLPQSGQRRLTEYFNKVRAVLENGQR